MAYSVAKNSLIKYPPSALKGFYLYGYEYVDCLHFLHEPGEFIETPELLPEYLHEASTLFLEAGWAGDGDIQLLWLAPFVFPLAMNVGWEGIILWHVKQKEDGMSWILSPIQLPFEEFRDAEAQPPNNSFNPTAT
jgi:hypothetical protein